MFKVIHYYLQMYLKINIKNKCIEINELHPVHFLSVPGLVWKACLKNAEMRLESLIDIDMLLMVEKGIRGGMCHK